MRVPRAKTEILRTRGTLYAYAAGQTQQRREENKRARDSRSCEGDQCSSGIVGCARGFAHLTKTHGSVRFDWRRCARWRLREASLFAY